MMDVANKDLCAELEELSGWGGTYWKWTNFYYVDGRGNRRLDRWCIKHSRTTNDGRLIIPAYDLGYLRGKLFSNVDGPLLARALLGGVDTTAKLAIELFKQGELKKEVS